MKTLKILCSIFIWPIALWVYCCSVASFFMWDNAFIIPIDEWEVGARVCFIIFAFVGYFIIATKADN
ncbi:MAG: hypothetical protein ACJASL_000123 [Paraglaciecola sp.]|jgi:hypothetical protein